MMVYGSLQTDTFQEKLYSFKTSLGRLLPPLQAITRHISVLQTCSGRLLIVSGLFRLRPFVNEKPVRWRQPLTSLNRKQSVPSCACALDRGKHLRASWENLEGSMEQICSRILSYFVRFGGVWTARNKRYKAGVSRSEDIAFIRDRMLEIGLSR